MSSLISVKNLSRHYGGICAVDDISFDLASGDILGFLGPNGAGKSSTMQMLSGNLAPSSGEISINGIDLLENPKQAKASLGYLPENPPLYKEMTVVEYLSFCARLHGIGKQQITKASDNAIEQCGLGAVQQRLIRNLSKGYQQRVGIAQAILHSPPVIILDEPTVGLDPIQILDIRSLIKSLGQNHGIILCTHILSEVQSLCNRVQIINNGKIVYSANMETLLHENENRYEFSLLDNISLDELSSYNELDNVQYLNDTVYIADSSLPADKLCAYIVAQGWRMNYFSRSKSSLEQVFIDLTLTDDQAHNADHRESVTTEGTV